MLLYGVTVQSASPSYQVFSLSQLPSASGLDAALNRAVTAPINAQIDQGTICRLVVVGLGDSGIVRPRLGIWP